MVDSQNVLSALIELVGKPWNTLSSNAILWSRPELQISSEQSQEYMSAEANDVIVSGMSIERFLKGILNSYYEPKYSSVRDTIEDKEESQKRQNIAVHVINGNAIQFQLTNDYVDTNGAK